MRSEERTTSDHRGDAYHRGMHQYHNHRYHRALKWLERAEKRGGVVATVARYYRALSHRAIGLEAMEAGRFDEAERHLRSAVADLGPGGDMPAYLARLYARTGRYDDCSRQTEKAIATGSRDGRAWLAHAQAQWRGGRRQEAQLTIRSALRRLGQDAGLLVQLGLFLAEEGRLAEATEQFRLATEADAGCADAHNFHALAAAAEQDCRQAVRSLQRAFELRPNDTVLAHRLSLAGKAAAQQGHTVSIRLPEQPAHQNGTHMGQLARYIAAEVDFVDAFLALPVSEADAELFGVLAAALEAALREHPDYADIHFRASAVLHRLGRLKDSLEHAREAVRINGAYVQARLLLARLCGEASEIAEGLEHVEAAIRRGADWPDAHCLAGELLIRSGRPEEARSCLRRALELNNGYTRAAEALASLAA